ncbi:MAG: sugar ABC transporter substrate-binding protein [Planctomycetota bacterium]|nr:sugar ABC transporter substrate-binding protein [Planctomycetota bacterium]
MRKFMLAMLVAVMLCGLSQAGQKPVIGLVCKAMDSEFWQDVKRGGEDAKKGLGDIELTVMAPDREVNVQQQVQLVEDLITQGVAGLALAPCGAQELIPVMEKAAAAGIPVVLVDTDAPWDKKLAYVGTNNLKGGNMAGEYMAGKMGGKGDVAFITGVMGHQTHIDRVGGAEAVFKKYPGIKIVAKQPANSERALAMSVMENILTSNPDLDFVFCTNAEMTMGAYEAIKAQGASAKLMGFDSATEVLTLIKDGEIDSLIAQSPYMMGKLGVEAVKKAIDGVKIDKVIDVPTGVVTKDNVGDYLK